MSRALAEPPEAAGSVAAPRFPNPTRPSRRPKTPFSAWLMHTVLHLCSLASPLALPAPSPRVLYLLSAFTFRTLCFGRLGSARFLLVAFKIPTQLFLSLSLLPFFAQCILCICSSCTFAYITILEFESCKNANIQSNINLCARKYENARLALDRTELWSAFEDFCSLIDRKCDRFDESRPSVLIVVSFSVSVRSSSTTTFPHTPHFDARSAPV